MLILTRKIGEQIFINEDRIQIVLLDINSYNRITLGIKAPEDISINRDEIYYQKQKEAQQEKLRVANF